jgi:hypothetical protein
MTLAKREDGPLVSIAELVRYRPSAFRTRSWCVAASPGPKGSLVLPGGHFVTGPA